MGTARQNKKQTNKNLEAAISRLTQNHPFLKAFVLLRYFAAISVIVLLILFFCLAGFDPLMMITDMSVCAFTTIFILMSYLLFKDLTDLSKKPSSMRNFLIAYIIVGVFGIANVLAYRYSDAVLRHEMVWPVTIAIVLVIGLGILMAAFSLYVMPLYRAQYQYIQSALEPVWKEREIKNYSKGLQVFGRILQVICLIAIVPMLILAWELMLAAITGETGIYLGAGFLMILIMPLFLFGVIMYSGARSVAMRKTKPRNVLIATCVIIAVLIVTLLYVFLKDRM